MLIVYLFIQAVLFVAFCKAAHQSWLADFDGGRRAQAWRGLCAALYAVILGVALWAWKT